MFLAELPALVTIQGNATGTISRSPLAGGRFVERMQGSSRLGTKVLDLGNAKSETKSQWS